MTESFRPKRQRESVANEYSEPIDSRAPSQEQNNFDSFSKENSRTGPPSKEPSLPRGQSSQRIPLGELPLKKNRTESRYEQALKVQTQQDLPTLLQNYEKFKSGHGLPEVVSSERHSEFLFDIRSMILTKIELAYRKDHWIQRVFFPEI